MSTFCGIIKEIPGVSLDRFDNENLNSKVFFLSHYHTDHMRGLFANEFLDLMLKDPQVCLYASAITLTILKDSNPDKNFNVRVLDVFVSKTISIPQRNEYFTVTAMPAGHCMGSIMFLFETDSKKILCTGDFRLDPKVFLNLPPLVPKTTIDNIYLDTTFFSRKFAIFPKRSYVVERVLSEIRTHLDASPLNKIKLVTQAYFAYEFVYKEIHKSLKVQLYGPANVTSVYRHVPEMDGIFTQDFRRSRIVVCRNKHEHSGISRFIKLSAFMWENETNNTFFTKDSNGNLFICYSTHASYEEIAQILNGLKPKVITPCVIPGNDRQAEELHTLIGDTLKNFANEAETSLEQTDSDLTFKIDQNYRYNKRRKVESDEDSLPGSPPRSRSLQKNYA